MTRKYSIKEIDRMRKYVYEIESLPHDTLNVASHEKRSEEILRTYMMNGTEPSELFEALKEARQARWDEEAKIAKRDAERRGRIEPA